MRALAAIVLLVVFVSGPARTEPASTESVGDVGEPMVSIASDCEVRPCPGVYAFSSDRPRVLGQGVYGDEAVDVWVPPGSSTLTTGSDAEVTRRTVPADMTLASPEFADGEPIPARFSCDGDTTDSPAVTWGSVPEGTAELAIVVEDPDTPFGTFVHWVMYGIDPSKDGLAEGETATVGTPWRGPCPPHEDPDHRYVFTLYAASDETGLEEGASTAELRDAIRETLLDQARLTGTYARSIVP